ncbi:MAG: hypothetical protein ACI9EF_001030 [Pseudohongiellaceae bacterium]|jgi:hypothetical protein
MMVPAVLSLLFALTSTVATAQGVAAEPVAAKSITAVPWFDGSYNGALSAARKKDCAVVLVFAPEWSSYSEQLRHETLQDEGVAAALQSSVCLDVDPDPVLGAQVVQLHNVEMFPTLAFLTSKGAAEDRIVGLIPAQALVRELARIAAGDFTVSDFRAQQKAAPSDLTLRNDLAEKLVWVGDLPRAGKLFDSIRRDDPEGSSLASARLAMQDVISLDGGGPTLLQIGTSHR